MIVYDDDGRAMDLYEAATKGMATDGVDGPSTERGLHLARAADVRAEPVTWLLEGGIPVGNVTLLGGPPGLAKTTLLCDWAARVSRGQLPGAFHDIPRSAVIMSGEDSIENTLKPRCEAAGADLDRVYFVKFGDEGLALPNDLGHLSEIISSVPDVVMLGIDPLMAFVADRIDSHKDHHIRRAFAALRRFAEDGGLAVPVVVHLNKSESRDFLNRIGGSVGIGAAVRSAWAVVRHPDAPEGADRLLVHVKSNLGPDMPTQRFRLEGRTTLAHDGREIPVGGIAWLGTDSTVTKENVLQVFDADERTERDEASDFLREALAAGPRLAKEIQREASELGITERTLKRARGAIGVDAQPVREAGRPGIQGWTLALPDVSERGLGGHTRAGGTLNPPGLQTRRSEVESLGGQGLGGQVSPVGGGPLTSGLDLATRILAALRTEPLGAGPLAVRLRQPSAAVLEELHVLHGAGQVEPRSDGGPVVWRIPVEVQDRVPDREAAVARFADEFDAVVIEE